MDKTTRLEYVNPDENAKKFWQINIQGAKITRQWGRIGTLGQTKSQDYPNKTLAASAYEQDVRAKLNKGYKQVSESEYGTEERFTKEEIDVSKDNLQLLIESL